MFEGLMTNIERRIQLFPFVKKGTYKVRALGSLEAENFFGGFQDLDTKGSGVMRPDDLSAAISTACELTEARFDPNRYGIILYLNSSYISLAHQIMLTAVLLISTKLILLTG